jgi:hypothetical protein
MRAIRRLGLFAVMCFLVASFLTAGCDSGRQNRPAPPAPPAPPPPPPPSTPRVTPPTVSDWKPDPKLLNELDTYWNVGDYQIRVPKFCEPQPPSNLGGKYSSYTKIKRWAGRLRNDGTRFMLSVLTATDLPADTNPNDVANEELHSIMGDVEDIHANSEWHEGRHEPGQISGMPFAKTTIEGNAGGKKGHWIRYITKNGATTIVISVLDFDNDDKRSLDVGITSVLTFRKK